jgi:hypothetical protein
MSVQDSVYSQSSFCNIFKHEIHAKSKYSYLLGYTNSLTKTNLIMMFAAIIIVCSDNCNVPIFSSHTLHHGCTNPRCLGVGCSVYVVRLLRETCTPAFGWDDILLECGVILIHVWRLVGVSKWCLHLVAHGLHLSSANTLVLIP